MLVDEMTKVFPTKTFPTKTFKKYQAMLEMSIDWDWEKKKTANSEAKGQK